VKAKRKKTYKKGTGANVGQMIPKGWWDARGGPKLPKAKARKKK
jgi:hypothetical protein